MTTKELYEEYRKVGSDKYSAFMQCIRDNTQSVFKKANRDGSVGAVHSNVIIDNLLMYKKNSKLKNRIDFDKLEAHFKAPKPISSTVEIKSITPIFPNVEDSKSKTVKEFMTLFFPNVNEGDRFIITKLLEDKIALQERVTTMYQEMETRLEGYKSMVENFIKTNNKKMEVL